MNENEVDEIAEIVERTEGGGMVDVIGLDVLELHEGVKTEEEAKAYVDKHVSQTFDLIQIEGRSFVIRSMVSDLNKVGSLIPEDMDAKTAIPIQMKIAEVLKSSGLNIGINAEMINEVQEELNNDPEHEDDTVAISK